MVFLFLATDDNLEFETPCGSDLQPNLQPNLRRTPNSGSKCLGETIFLQKGFTPAIQSGKFTPRLPREIQRPEFRDSDNSGAVLEAPRPTCRALCAERDGLFFLL